MNNTEKYFIMLVIVWRLTHLFTAEDGPFDIIIRFRKLRGDSFWGKLMDCFYCLSVWMGLLCACVEADGAKEIVILTLYYSGASILIEKLTNKNFT
jgi:hypothetical protein